MAAKLNQPPSSNWLALQKVGELISSRRRRAHLEAFAGDQSNPLPPVEEEKTWS
jgi:hypothetical protein